MASRSINEVNLIAFSVHTPSGSLNGETLLSFEAKAIQQPSVLSAGSSNLLFISKKKKRNKNVIYLACTSNTLLKCTLVNKSGFHHKMSANGRLSATIGANKDTRHTRPFGDELGFLLACKDALVRTIEQTN